MSEPVAAAPLPTSGEPVPGPRAPDSALRAMAWLLAFVCVAGALHLWMPFFFDGDTGYHLAVARMTATHGVLHAFPWTPFSWMAEHYADKELLFHWLLIPVSSLDPLVAARIAGTVLGAAVLMSAYGVLRRERVPSAGAWALLMLACSSAFVARFAMVRPHLLSIVLAIWLAWAVVRKRTWLVAFTAFLFPLCYTAWHLPPAIFATCAAGQWLAGHKPSARDFAVLLLALALGVLAHPNFPENLELFWIQNFRVLVDTAWSKRDGFDLGGEFKPFSPKGFLRYVLAPAALACAALALGLRQRARDPLPLCFGALAAAFTIMTLLSQRFIEYLVPFAVVACALAWRPRARAVWLLVGLGLAFTSAFGTHPLRKLASRSNPIHAPVPATLQAMIPRGAQVVTCDWRYTGEMMLALPERRFVVALDPVFFAAHDPARYRTWFEAVRGLRSNTAELLRTELAADFVMCEMTPEWRAVLTQLAADPMAKLLGRAGPWAVFDLRSAP